MKVGGKTDRVKDHANEQSSMCRPALQRSTSMWVSAAVFTDLDRRCRVQVSPDAEPTSHQCSMQAYVIMRPCRAGYQVTALLLCMPYGGQAASVPARRDNGAVQTIFPEPDPN